MIISRAAWYQEGFEGVVFFAIFASFYTTERRTKLRGLLIRSPRQKAPYCFDIFIRASPLAEEEDALRSQKRYKRASHVLINPWFNLPSRMFSLSSLFILLLPVLAVGAAPLDGTTGSLSRRAATVYTSCTTPNTVALTFDDGPYMYNQEIVDMLDSAGAKGTFFFNGNNFNCIYDQASMDRVRYAYNHGHMIGSHTWAHRDLATLTGDQINDEMYRVELALQRIIGVTPAFMRPPYGSYNQMVLDVSGARGQGVVIWDFDSGDSTGASADQSKANYDNIINQHPDTILTLNHETSETTVHQVLPYALQRLKDAGYSLVSLDQCLGLPAYQSVGAPGTPDSSWTC